MNFLASECSSGCESGWTNYLEQSYLSSNPSNKGHRKSSGFCDEQYYTENKGKEEVVFVEEEEDLSMVSDASSGPPHFYEDFTNDDNQYQYTSSKSANSLNQNGGKRHKTKEYRRSRRGARQDKEVPPSFLDDTASSPLINFSKNTFSHTNNQASMERVFEYPQLGFSATHFQGGEGGPAFQDHFGFLQSNQSGNELQNNQWF